MNLVLARRDGAGRRLARAEHNGCSSASRRRLRRARLSAHAARSSSWKRRRLRRCGRGRRGDARDRRALRRCRRLSAIARHAQGQMLIKTGRVKEGLALMDEAMVAVTAGELSPVITGIVYCGVILALQEVYEVRRAREWTAALTRWCNGQPDLKAFTGRCLVHRAEILQLRDPGGMRSTEAQKAQAALCRDEERVQGRLRAVPGGGAQRSSASSTLRRRRTGRRAARVGAAAGAGAAASRARASRCGVVDDPPRARRGDRSAQARRLASCVRRDPACRR